jgi:hypothetical protein
VDFENPVAGLVLTLHGSQGDTEANKAATVESWRQSQAGRAPERTISGLSLGDHGVVTGGDFFETEGFVLFREHVVADRYVLVVEVQMKRKGTPAQLEERRRQVPIWCERAARVILADAMAMDLNDDATPRATQHLTGIEADKTGYTIFSKWAQEHKVAIKYDETTASASFTYKSKQVRLLLASKMAIVNGREVELGGKFVLARGSLWFVPGKELTDAIK